MNSYKQELLNSINYYLEDNQIHSKPTSRRRIRIKRNQQRTVSNSFRTKQRSYKRSLPNTSKLIS